MSSTKTIRHLSDDVDPAEVRTALEKILASRHFVNAHKKKAFLRLVCDLFLEGKAQEVNEYRLAFDVFGRDTTYHPSNDPIVRVVAHDIRKKLELYYQTEGALDDIRLELPSGSYQPTFSRLAPPAAEEPEEVAAPAPPPVEAEPVAPIPAPAEPALAAPRVTPGQLVAAVVAAVFLTAIVTLGVADRRAAPGPTAADALGKSAFWAPFMNGGTAPLVVLSNPPVLRLANASDPPSAAGTSVPLPPDILEEMKDKFVLEPKVMVREQAADQGVVKQRQVPRLIYSRSVYTGVGEAIALYHLTNFFGSVDRGVLLKQSRTLSAEDLKDHNIILLGGGWANEWVGKLGGNEEFVFTGSGTVENRNPRPGEEAQYIPQFDGPTGNLLVDYAIITVKPSLSQANRALVLAGIYSQGTEAAAEYITNRTYLEQLEQRLRQVGGPAGAPTAFQALLKVGVENGIPTTITVLALHEM